MTIDRSPTTAVIRASPLLAAVSGHRSAVVKQEL